MNHRSNPTSALQLDGSFGEGGGQILRSALALSMITGRPFHLRNIRAKRRRPGLMRQHLTSVLAAAEVCGGEAIGATTGSTELSFTPATVRGGNYSFSIGTAGSTSLVLQTVLPALLCANEPSTILLEGGTHNGQAPCTHFLTGAFLPIIEQMGPQVRIDLLQHGFYPAGGGRIRVEITPVPRLTPLHILERGATVAKQIVATVANLPSSIGKRELHLLARLLKATPDELDLQVLQTAIGPGNVINVELRSEQITEVFTGFGERNVSAEQVASRTAEAVQAYLAIDAPVGVYLADQLLLPFALAGSGVFRTGPLSNHSRTNAAVIEQFLPLQIRFNSDSAGPAGTVSVEAGGSPAPDTPPASD